ncbi:retropepsin-like aspartic protease family protein [Entomomonas asaccharolytica]|nr:TIGR02281 family clan AA aspartic protease [Entomomonas asaccharolytica]
MTDQNQQPAGKGAGKTMMIIAWLVGMLLAVKFFASWEEGKMNPNKNPQSTYTSNYIEVVLDSGRGGHYMATGRINGQTVTFMLDTGATQVAVSESLANRLNLKKQMPVDLSTANGMVRGWTTMLDTVALGGIEIQNVRATIVPNMDDEVLLGMSFLRQLEFTQRNNQLILRQYKSN